jgi:chaperone required for assembly of F1-ATPase
VERPRRFYKSVSIGPADGGFAVWLDGKGVKTPARRPLTVPTQALARLLAQEWDAQGATIDLSVMDATRLAFTAIDFVGDARDATAAEVGRYAGSDTLCYFAEGPQSLVQRQARDWGALLDWAAQALDVRFLRVTGVVHQPQPAATLLRIARLAEADDDFRLAGVAHATALFGSAILAQALRRGRLDGATAFALSRLEETFQEERWGVDAEAALRTAAMRREALMLEQWFAALAEG